MLTAEQIQQFEAHGYVVLDNGCLWAADTLICFDGLLPHYSAANRSSQARHAYTLHVVDGQAHYPETNWIQRGRDFPVRGFN